MRNRVIAVILSAAMALTALPVNIMADEITGLNCDAVTVEAAETVEEESVPEEAEAVSEEETAPEEAMEAAEEESVPEEAMEVAEEESVPEEAMEAAEEESVSQEGGDYLKSISGTCGNHLTWTLTDEKVLTISGKDSMYDYSREALGRIPWYIYRGTITSVIISEGVTSVGSYAFYDCSNLTEVRLPESMDILGEGAFSGCSFLTDISFPRGMRMIGSSAFRNCLSLRSISLSSASYLKVIGDCAFYDCVNLGNIIIPKRVEVIGPGAFAGCTGIGTVEFYGNAPACSGDTFSGDSFTAYYPYGNSTWSDEARQQYGGAITWFATFAITEQPTDLFAGPGAMASSSVKAIGQGLSYRWYVKEASDASWQESPYEGSDTETIRVPITASGLGTQFKCVVTDEDGDQLESDVIETTMDGVPCGETVAYTVSNGVVLLISGQGPMYDFDSSEIERFPWYKDREKIEAVCISDGVTNIGDYSFYDFTNLERVVVPDSVTSIGKYAFRNCSALRQLSKLTNVASIGEGAFFDCKSIDSITLSDELTEIGNVVFKECQNLKNITLPEGITKIGNEAFFECKSLVDLAIPGSVASIGAGAFERCTKLAGIALPEGIVKIEKDLFNNCDYLREVIIPGTVKEIEERAFYQCLRLRRAEIPEGVTKISEDAFNGCYYLEEVVLPDSVTEIGDRAFRYCQKLKSIFFPKQVAVIGEEVCYGCGSLNYVLIPASVTEIKSGAFARCETLEYASFRGSAPVMAENIFEKDNLTAYYNCTDPTWTREVMTPYGGAILWAYSIKLFGQPESIKGENGAIGKASVSTAGERISYQWYSRSMSDDCWEACDFEGSDTKSVSIPINFPNAQRRYKCVITNAHGDRIDTDEISITLTGAKCGDNMYWTLNGEGELRIYGKGRSYYYYDKFRGDRIVPWFDNIENVKTIVVEEGVEGFEENIFKNHHNLERVKLPESLWMIGYMDFGNCEKLEEINIPEGMIRIGDSAFYNCESLKSTRVPDKVDYVNIGCYERCINLTDITIGAGVRVVAISAFADCEKLRTVTFRGNAPRIAEGAFSGDTLTAYYPEGNETWTDEVLGQYGGNIEWVPYRMT